MAGFPWGCSCGRLCDANDATCDACGGAKGRGEELRTAEQRTAFLRRAERQDGRALRGVLGMFAAVEASYRAAEEEFDRHANPLWDFEGGGWREGDLDPDYASLDDLFMDSED